MIFSYFYDFLKVSYFPLGVRYAFIYVIPTAKKRKGYLLSRKWGAVFLIGGCIDFVIRTHVLYGVKITCELASRLEKMIDNMAVTYIKQ